MSSPYRIAATTPTPKRPFWCRIGWHRRRLGTCTRCGADVPLTHAEFNELLRRDDDEQARAIAALLDRYDISLQTMAPGPRREFVRIFAEVIRVKHMDKVQK